MNIIPQGAKQFLLSAFLMLGVFVVVPENSTFACSALQPLYTKTFFASVDTMKVSRDTENHPLSNQEIVSIVNALVKLHVNYITVDTNWDYASYMQQWVNAIRAVGVHVWFRSAPNQWEDLNGTTGIMTPAQYEASEQQFIITHPTFFRSGDILDSSPEPENGPYWISTYGNAWSWQPAAPNVATKAFNAFLRATTDVANAALQSKGIYGVITTVRSLNSFFLLHPSVLEQATVNKFQYLTVDSYPEGSTTNPTTATNARISELKAIENLWHLPIVIGEMGYSNEVPVSDTVQQNVLSAEFNALAGLPYVAGLNYWVGPGSNTAGGYTYIFREVNGAWLARPAAYSLAAFFQTKL
jgi:hypothetical protein